MPSGEQRERRVFDGQVTVRADDQAADTLVLEGYAAVFESETIIHDWGGDFREVIDRGAFDEAIGRDDVRALFNHDSNLVLGRNRSGTLTLSVDDSGLKYAVRLPNTSYARDLYEVVSRGDVSQSSFAFMVTKHKTDPPANDQLPLRHIIKVELFDISPVAFPAYEMTSVSARTRDEIMAFRKQSEQDEAEQVEAKARCARAWLRLQLAEAE